MDTAYGADTTYTQDADHLIVSAAQRGCHDSFAELVERHGHGIERYFLRHTHDPELAADLTQDTFLDAFRRLDRWQHDRPFAAWLYRIAHYNLLHAWRRQRTRRTSSLDQLIEQQGDALGALHQRDDVPRAHEREAIHQSLAALSPTLREPLILHSVYGFTGYEIAHMYAAEPAAIRQRVARAKGRFRDAYARHTADSFAS